MLGDFNSCAKIGTEHVQVLYYAQVFWLSREKVLSHFYELRVKFTAFLLENYFRFVDLDKDGRMDRWI